MLILSSKLLLLTGAGFTKNFDGFLASEMWAKIFNNPVVQKTEKIRKLLLEDFDFESVYASVTASSVFTDEDKRSFQNAVSEAYKKLDDNVRGWVFNDSNPTALNKYGLGELLNLFNGIDAARGMFFTLNQDLFIERHFQHRAPGAPPFPGDVYNLFGKEFGVSDFITLPLDDVASKVEGSISGHGGMVYIKLHGSYGWRSSDGRNQMVLGHDKEGEILREPLLRYYLELFKNAIADGGKRLLVIGYGFRDQHINKILTDGVNKHGLKLIIITPSSISDFRRSIINGHFYAKGMLDGLTGYFPYTLREIFPPNQNRTTYFEEIRDALLS